MAKTTTKATKKANSKSSAKQTASKKTAVAKVPATKAASKSVTAKAPAKVAAKATVAAKVTKVAKEIVKQVSKVVSKNSPKEKVSKATVKEVIVKEKLSKKEQTTEKPALMTKKGKAEPQEPKDQGELLIEKAREEMAKINADAKQAEKASKVKPIKIERGNSADEKAKWQELNKRHGKEKAQVYKMTDVFEAMKPIQHKVLGWGFVLTNENNRLEVLFENGIKMLISNYKPS
ncbi:MAG: hypothetical protein ACK4VO_06570 [Pseudobdellovibrio sp.]